MNYRYIASVFTVLAIGVLTPIVAGAQSTNSTVQRTVWGDPDLQGVWHSSGAVPMERPDEYQGRTTLNDEETAARRQEANDRDQQLLLAERRQTVAGGTVGAYNNFWMER